LMVAFFLRCPPPLVPRAPPDLFVSPKWGPSFFFRCAPMPSTLFPPKSVITLRGKTLASLLTFFCDCFFGFGSPGLVFLLCFLVPPPFCVYWAIFQSRKLFCVASCRGFALLSVVAQDLFLVGLGEHLRFLLFE